MCSKSGIEIFLEICFFQKHRLKTCGCRSTVCLLTSRYQGNGSTRQVRVQWRHSIKGTGPHDRYGSSDVTVSRERVQMTGSMGPQTSQHQRNGSKWQVVTQKLNFFCRVSPNSTRLFCYITCTIKRTSFRLFRFKISQSVPFLIKKIRTIYRKYAKKGQIVKFEI